MKRLIWIAVATLAGVGVLTLAVFRPVSANISKVENERVAAQAQTEQLSRRLAELNELASREDEVRAEQQRFLVALPDDPAAAELIRHVQNAADSSGVRLDGFSPTIPQVSTTPNIEQITLTLRAGGTWNSIRSFVDTVMNGVPRAVRIDTVTVAPGGTPSLLDAPEATVTLTTKVYVNAPAPAVPAPAPDAAQ